MRAGVGQRSVAPNAMATYERKGVEQQNRLSRVQARVRGGPTKRRSRPPRSVTAGRQCLNAARSGRMTSGSIANGGRIGQESKNRQSKRALSVRTGTEQVPVLSEMSFTFKVRRIGMARNQRLVASHANLHK